MKSKKFLSLFAFIVIMIISINYSYSIEPDVFVQSTVNRASEALNNKYSKEEKIKKLKEIASETVDIDGIGRYTLGSYKNKITDSQMKEYKMGSYRIQISLKHNKRFIWKNIIIIIIFVYVMINLVGLLGKLMVT